MSVPNAASNLFPVPNIIASRYEVAAWPMRTGALGWPRVCGFSCVFGPRGSAFERSFPRMKMLAHFGMRRIATGWVVFIAGLLLLLWLHTFRDTVAHAAIFPLLFFLWIVLAGTVWDGCKAVTPRVRLALLSLQAIAALAASALFFQHLLRTSL